MTLTIVFFMAVGAAGGEPTVATPPSAPVRAAASRPAGDQGDVVIDVPRLELAKLGVDLEKLNARLAVDAKVAHLVEITAGIDTQVDKLKMQLEGVQAETHLVVRLGRVADVLQQALEAISKHPELATMPGAPTASTSPPPAAPGAVAVSVPAPPPVPAQAPHP